jgi:hypothetical protein
MSSAEYSSHPENVQEMEVDLRRREMNKMFDAKMKMRKVFIDGGGSSGDGSNNVDFDITDMTEKDITIVCEELWVDFKKWMNHQKNARDCSEKVYTYIVGNWVTLLSVSLFMIAFRWYIGAGKDACDYGFGWGAVSLICEVMRHVGEILLAILMILCGLCCGMFPVIACICIYQLTNEDDDYGDDDDDDDGSYGYGYGYGVDGVDEKEKKE